ncbi:MAG TPA: GAF domain-containing protein [Terriglobales bacterium]|nr:GAF domain-containing protein [Terriglobales bacterium]
MENVHPAVTTAEQNALPRNRRCRPRHRIHSPGYASLADDPGRTALDLSEIIDISEDGLALQAEPPLRPNDRVNLALDLGETPKIRAAGLVIWSDQRGRAGIRFEQLGEEPLQELRQWLMVNALVAYSKHQDAVQGESPIATAAGAPANTSAIVTPRHIETPSTDALRTATDVIAELEQELQPISGNPDEAFQVIAARAQQLTRATGAAIAVRPNESAAEEIMVCRASSGSHAPSVGSKLQVGSGFSGACVRAGELLRCDDTDLNDLVDRDTCQQLGIRSILAGPVIRHDQVVGLLEVFSPTPNHFGDADCALLQRIAGLIATVLDTAPAVQATPGSWVGYSGTLFGTEAPGEADQNKSDAGIPVPRSHLVLLIAAAALIALVLGYVLAPWIQEKVEAHAAAKQRITKPIQAPEFARHTSLPGTLEELRTVAEHGDANAQFALGSRYATGEDVPQDYAQAAQWFNRAAEQGHVVAQATLAAYYWGGMGVSKDISKAYFWSILARAGGDEGSKFRAAALTSRMTRAQVLAAQQQADDWLRRHQVATTSSENP